jgi:hypothetical protein
MRGAGQAFAYNLGRAMSGLFILGVSLIATVAPISVGMLITALFGIGCAITATLFLPETAGRDLAARQPS